MEIVDTTCPWVSKVWNTVDAHQRKGLTSIIHGKYAHEETVATTSFCEDYICVKDMKEAEMVADYMVNGGDKEAFLEYFKNAVSEGFDPDTMLEKVGLANQTTMYKKETKAIGQLFQKTIMKKFGPSKVDEHYFEFDTICDATQVSKLLIPIMLNIQPANLTLNNRSVKTLLQSLSRTKRITAWTSSWSLGAGIHPIRLTCWRSPTTKASDHSILTVLNASGLITPSHIEQLMVK